MHVKITSNYTSAEIIDILTRLAHNELLTTQELAEAAVLFSERPICFLDINDLLLPFIEKFVGYSKEEQDLTRLTRNPGALFQSITQRLLQGCPLRQLAPTFTFDNNQWKLTIQAGHLSNTFRFTTLPEYEQNVLRCINDLLKQHQFDAAYHEIGYEEHTIFPLLTQKQYDDLFTNRLLQFAHVEYPEVEAWRESLKNEDYLF